MSSRSPLSAAGGSFSDAEEDIKRADPPPSMTWVLLKTGISPPGLFAKPRRVFDSLLGWHGVRHWGSEHGFSLCGIRSFLWRVPLDQRQRPRRSCRAPRFTWRISLFREYSPQGRVLCLLPPHPRCISTQAVMEAVERRMLSIPGAGF